MNKIELSKVLFESITQDELTESKSIENLYKLIVTSRALQKNVDVNKANLELLINNDLSLYGKCDPCLLQKHKNFIACSECEIQDEIENDVRATQQSVLFHLESDIKKMKLFSRPQYIVENVSCNDILDDLISNKLIDRKNYSNSYENNTQATTEKQENNYGSDLDCISEDKSIDKNSDSDLDRILDEQFKRENIDINAISSSEDAFEDNSSSSDEVKQSSASDFDDEVSLDDELLDELYQ